MAMAVLLLDSAGPAWLVDSAGPLLVLSCCDPRGEAGARDLEGLERSPSPESTPGNQRQGPPDPRSRRSAPPAGGDGAGAVPPRLDVRHRRQPVVAPGRRFLLDHGERQEQGRSHAP